MQCRKLEPIATHTRLEFDQRLHVKTTNFPVKQILLQVRLLDTNLSFEMIQSTFQIVIWPVIEKVDCNQQYYVPQCKTFVNYSIKNRNVSFEGYMWRIFSQLAVKGGQDSLIQTSDLFCLP